MRALRLFIAVALMLGFSAVFPLELHADPTNYQVQVQGTPSAVGTQLKSPTEYFTNLYNWMLGIVGISALFAIVYGGVLYIFSGAVESTSEARRWITNAIFGLVLAGLSFLILNTINPELVKEFNVESIIEKAKQSIPTKEVPAKEVPTEIDF